jgi:prevent-host-death family protein
MKMEFMPMRTLSRNTQALLERLQRDGEVIVTNNGQPSILMIDLSGRDLFETVGNYRKITTNMPSPQKQHEALKRFFTAIDAIDGEAITDADLAHFERNRLDLGRELDI